MPTLFARLSLLFAAFLLCLGLLTWAIAHQSQQRYFAESSQALSRPVAMYMASQVSFFVDGQPDTQALEALASHVMMINPSLDVYLLDETGRIIASAISDDELQSGIVDLAPIRQFLAADARLPVYGDNPRNTQELRVFSAFPVSDSSRPGSGCDPCGYVYAVLGAPHEQTFWQSILTSHSVQSSTLMLIGVLIFSLFAGMAVFFMLTRPLRRLSKAMSQWQLSKDSPHDSQSVLLLPESGQQAGQNELTALASTCQAMASRLASQYRALDRQDANRREFMTSISHDLRTPLTSLSGALETLLIKHGVLSEDQKRHYLKLSLRQCQRLMHLISQVFELARLDSAETTVQLEPVSLSELVMDTLQDLKPRAKRRGVSLVFEPKPADMTLCVSTDITLLNRVLDNLLVNAIRHTDRGGTVSVLVYRESKVAKVSIEDTGCGFSTRMCNQTLTSVQASQHGAVGRHGSMGDPQCPKIDHENQSSGLGLGIVARILVLLKSDSGVWSEPGKGTRIMFSLPLNV